MSAWHAGALVFNVGLNRVLIPLAGPMGAAVAALATSVLVAGSTMVFAARRLFVSLDRRRALRLVVANSCLALVAFLGIVVGMPWPGAASAALIAYPLFLWLWRAARRDEIALVLGGIR